jgi:hypothetical protein
MGASAWTVFDCAKHHFGMGKYILSAAAAGYLQMTLHKSAASTNISAATITTWASIGNECAGGGYDALGLCGITWAAGVSAGVQKLDFSDPVFTASGGILSNVRYAVVYVSTSAGGGTPLCYAALSTAEFDVTTSNTLTIQLAATGCFTLA